jgi:hypothetical protein
MTLVRFIAELRDCLRWEAKGFSTKIRSAYYQHLAEGVDIAIRKLADLDPETADVASILLKAITPEQHLDFITAPHIASMILWPDTFVQRRRRNFFLKTLGVCAGCISDESGLHNHRGELTPPVVCCNPAPSGYRVSFGGELTIPYMDRGGNRLRPVSSECACLILRKLNSADSVLQDINLNARVFAIDNTETIAFRYEADYEREFSSGSFQTLPGFSLICNCHICSVSELALADSIIHEAIHSIIYRYEAIGEPLLRAGEMNPPKVTSPWSGARLNVESFAQACLVWFGLHHFWKNVCDLNEEYGELYLRATKGFHSRRFLESCRLSAGYLSIQVAAQLEELRDCL